MIPSSGERIGWVGQPINVACLAFSPDGIRSPPLVETSSPFGTCLPVIRFYPSRFGPSGSRSPPTDSGSSSIPTAKCLHSTPARRDAGGPLAHITGAGARSRRRQRREISRKHRRIGEDRVVADRPTREMRLGRREHRRIGEQRIVAHRAARKVRLGGRERGGAGLAAGVGVVGRPCELGREVRPGSAAESRQLRASCRKTGPAPLPPAEPHLPGGPMGDDSLLTDPSMLPPSEPHLPGGPVGDDSILADPSMLPTDLRLCRRSDLAPSAVM